MKSPLIATIQVPLQDMLPAAEFEKLMAYAEREGLTPDAVMLRALEAFIPQMTPPTPPEPAKAAKEFGGGRQRVAIYPAVTLWPPQVAV